MFLGRSLIRKSVEPKREPFEMPALISCASGGWKVTTTFIDRLVSNELIIGISLKKFITKSLAISDEDKISLVPFLMSIDTDGLPVLFESRFCFQSWLGLTVHTWSL